MATTTYTPEIFTEGFLAFLELHNDNLQFRDEAWFVAGGLHLQLQGQST